MSNYWWRFTYAGEVSVTRKIYSRDDKTQEWSFTELELVRLPSGNCFGELALKNDQRRSATTTTVRDTHLAVLSKRYFELTLNTVSESAAYIQQFASMNIFRDWKYMKIKMIYDICQEVELPIHSYIYNEGDPLKCKKTRPRWAAQ